ncbi:ATP-binding protein [Thalassiella azotivora]
MATVGLSFTALPEHVRTARLVAVAVARRQGASSAVLESVRLAVGEACARAVARSVAARTGRPVEVELLDGDDGLEIRVRDHAPPRPPDHVEELSLTLVQGLAHDAAVVEDGGSSELRMHWRF